MKRPIVCSRLVIVIAVKVLVVAVTTNLLGFVAGASFIATGSLPSSRERFSCARSPSSVADRRSLLFASPPNQKSGPRSSSSYSSQNQAKNNRRKNASNSSPSNSSFAVSKEINGRLIEAGKKFDWIGILQIYEKDKANFDHVNYSTSMSQLGRIRSLRKDDARFEDLMLDIAAQIQKSATRSSWGARQMANVLHTVAKMKWKSKGVSAIVKTILQEDNVHVIVTQGEPQNIANTAWACATLGVQCPALFIAINDRASYLVEQGNPQNIANTAWACATLGVQCPAFFTAIDDRASYLVGHGNPQNIANTAWACATLGVQSPALFTAIDDRAPYLVGEGTAQAIANTAWACGTLGVQCPAFFSAIDDRASYLVEQGNPQEIANTAWALAQLGRQSRNFFDAFSSRLASILESTNVQDITNLCYSFAILDLAQEYETEFRLLWSRALQLDGNELNGEQNRQLFQTFIMVSRLMELPPPKELLKLDAMLDNKDNRDSRAQREMSALLEELGFAHQIEASPFPDRPFVPGLLAIDAACKDRMIAIEFDGPSHFLRDVKKDAEGVEGRIENGPTQAKRRFLERLGWKVVNVPWWEWRDATRKDQKKKLLTKKLLATRDGRTK